MLVMKMRMEVVKKTNAKILSMPGMVQEVSWFRCHENFNPHDNYSVRYATETGLADKVPRLQDMRLHLYGR